MFTKSFRFNPRFLSTTRQRHETTSTFNSRFNAFHTSKSLLQDFYKTLNLKPTATEHEIKNSFAKLAKQFHPDVYYDDKGEKFKKILEAYKTLSDPVSKIQYDSMNNFITLNSIWNKTTQIKPQPIDYNKLTLEEKLPYLIKKLIGLDENAYCRVKSLYLAATPKETSHFVKFQEYWDDIGPRIKPYSDILSKAGLKVEYVPPIPTFEHPARLLITGDLTDIVKTLEDHIALKNAPRLT